MLLELIIAAAVAIGAFCLIWLLRGIVLTPVPSGRNLKISVIIDAQGDAPELESTVNALCWLRKNGTLRAGIVVRDKGMSEETARMAKLLARSGTIELT